MYNGPYGGPPWPYGPVYAPPMPQQKSALEVLQDIDAQMEGMKKFRKHLLDEDREEKKKSTHRKEAEKKFTFGEVFGLFSMLALLSVVAPGFQMWFYTALQNVFH